MKALAKKLEPLWRSEPPLLEWSPCQFQIEGRLIFETERFSIEKGDRIFIRGPVGSGKSQFFSALRKRFDLSTSVFLLPQSRMENFHAPVTLGEMRSLLSPQSSRLPLLTKEQRSKNWNTASGGERTLCLLEAAISSHSELLILDECSMGLDSQQWERSLRNLRQWHKRDPRASLIAADHRELDLPWTKIFEIQGRQLVRVE